MGSSRDPSNRSFSEISRKPFSSNRVAVATTAWYGVQLSLRNATISSAGAREVVDPESDFFFWDVVVILVVFYLVVVVVVVVRVVLVLLLCCWLFSSAKRSRFFLCRLRFGSIFFPSLFFLSLSLSLSLLVRI